MSDSGLPASRNGSPDGGSLALLRYGRTILEHWRLVVVCIVVTLVGAGVYVKLAPRKYEAQAQMLVSPINPTDTVTVGLPVLHSTSDPTRDTLTAASLITTPQVAEAVIKDLGLHTTPTGLLSTVTATPIGQSNLIAVQAQASAPTSARRIANSFVEAVIKIRTAALHAALATVIPGLQAQLLSEPPAQRASDSALTAEIAQLKQLQTSHDPTITPSSTAQLPTGPYTPRTKLALIAGLLAGLIIGVAAAFAVDALDPRLRREDQLRELLGLRVLARIPRVRRMRRRRGREGRRGPMLPGELSPVAHEGYRVLRMMLGRGSRTGGRTYLITGSAPAEGKTTSAINLAVSIAQSGRSVILIELDLRRPMILRSLNLKGNHGTEHVISGRYDLNEAVTEVTVAGSPFWLLAVQSPQAELADSLGYEVIHELVSAARDLAEYVVIDSPPLTAVIDALPLANAVDEVVIVARLGVSRLARLMELRELLTSQNATVAGVLLIGEHARSEQAYYQAAAPVAPPIERRGVTLGPIPSSTSPRK